MGKPRRRKGKIRIKTGAKLINKNDATRVARSDAPSKMKRMPTQLPRSNGAVLKVKLKKR